MLTPFTKLVVSGNEGTLVLLTVIAAVEAGGSGG